MRLYAITLPTLALGLCTVAVAQTTLPREVQDETGIVPAAQQAVQDYHAISEWSGTFLVEQVTPARGTSPEEVETYRITFHERRPAWYIDAAMLDGQGRAKWRATELYDGRTDFVYMENDMTGLINTVEEPGGELRMPNYPPFAILAQEVRSLVSGCASLRSVRFDYYTGPGPKDVSAVDSVGLVSMGKTGWTYAVLDKSRSYIPLEVWRGTHHVAGKARSIFSDWKQDEKGRYFAGRLTEELRLPNQEEINVVYRVKTEAFSRKTDPTLLAHRKFPKGTRVLIDMRSESEYIEGG